MTPQTIRFNVPTLEGRELEHVETAMRSGHTSSSGPMSEAAGEILREETGAAGVLLTTSCTAALELSGMLLDIGPGDTVIVEQGTPLEAMIPALKALGHANVTARYLPIKGNAIERGPHGWVGAADPRSDGVAIAQ